MRSEALSFLREQLRIGRFQNFVAPVPLHAGHEIRFLRSGRGGDRYQSRNYLFSLHDLDFLAFGELGFDLFKGVPEIANRRSLHM